MITQTDDDDPVPAGGEASQSRKQVIGVTRQNQHVRPSQPLTMSPVR